MQVIDAHVHLYPTEVNRDPAGWAAAHREPLWSLMCTRLRKDTGQPVQSFPSVHQLLHDMDKAGVARAILLGWYWENHASCVMQNRFYAKCVQSHPDRFSAFAAVHPSAGDTALEEMRRAREDGLFGLGELSPHSQRFAIHDPRWLAIMGLASEWDWPVNLHVTEPEGRAYPGRVDTPLTDFHSLSRNFPQLRFILAHWGGRLWRTGETWPANVWVDTAAAPLIYRATTEIWTQGLTAVGPDRVLWGTDYPLILYPQVCTTETQLGFLTEAKTRIPLDEQKKVLGRNAIQLLAPRH